MWGSVAMSRPFWRLRLDPANPGPAICEAMLFERKGFGVLLIVEPSPDFPIDAASLEWERKPEPWDELPADGWKSDRHPSEATDPWD